MSRTKQLVLLVVAAAVAFVLVQRGTVSVETALLLGALVPSVILHEVSHGAAAFACGDDTAKQAGRLTLNPVAHIDPFGTILLPVMLLVITRGAAVFGYAKPVPVNPRRMREPVNQALLVSLAGPGTNIALALLAAAAYRVLVPSLGGDAVLIDFIGNFGIVNVVLAVFNLIPIPPLDGSAVIERFLPMQWWEGYLRLRQYSMFFLVAFIWIVPLDDLFIEAITLWARLLS